MQETSTFPAGRLVLAVLVLAVLLRYSVFRPGPGTQRSGADGAAAARDLPFDAGFHGPAPDVHVIAHRGASRLAPENTLAAFRRAIELGAKAIECDVLFTADDVPVVVHHENLADRVPPEQRPARVSELTLARLQRLDVGSWFSDEFRGERIPTLRETLSQLKGQVEWLYLHDKHTNDYSGGRRIRLQRFIDEIRRSGMTRQIIVMVESGFDSEWKRLGPEIALMKCWIEPDDGEFGPDAIENACRRAFQAGYRHFGIEHEEDGAPLDGATADAWRRAASRYKALGCSFTIFTINRETAIEQFLDLGFTGIGTDDLTVALARLEVARARLKLPTAAAAIRRTAAAEAQVPAADSRGPEAR